MFALGGHFWLSYGVAISPLGDRMTRKDDKGDQPSGGETTWTKKHGTQELPKDDEFQKAGK